jgi:transposase
MAAQALNRDFYRGDIFVFRSKRRDRLKLLVFDGTGTILATKWLEEGAFTFPPVQDGAIVLTATQLSVLVAGLDWTRVAQKPVKRPCKTA